MGEKLPQIWNFQFWVQKVVYLQHPPKNMTSDPLIKKKIEIVAKMIFNHNTIIVRLKTPYNAGPGHIT